MRINLTLNMPQTNPIDAETFTARILRGIAETLEMEATLELGVPVKLYRHSQEIGAITRLPELE